MAPLEIGVAVASAIVLFLFGIEHFSKEIQSVTGERFRRFLAKGTEHRLAAFGLGALVTAIIQSSTATSVIAVGLVNAGVMTFRQSLGIIFGANVGTTVTAQLVALKLTSFAPALILFGFVVGLLPFRWRIFGRSIFYFGVVFFSLNLVSAAVEPLKANESVRVILASLNGNLTIVVVGAIFTALVQSSSVATGVAIIMLSQGALRFEQALPLLVGANVGTTVTSLIAAASADTSARRTAMSHLLYNVGGALLFLPFLTPFGAALQRLELSPESTLATAHLIFNVVTAAVFLAAADPFARLVSRLVRDDIVEDEPLRLLTEADFASDDGGREALNTWLADAVRVQTRSYVASVLALETRDSAIASRAQRTASTVDFALEEAARLVRSLSTGDPGEKRSEVILRLVIGVDHVRQVQDSLWDLRRIHERLEAQHARFSIDGLLEVQAVYPITAKLLQQLESALRTPGEETLAALSATEAQASSELQRAYRRFLDLVRRVEERGELADFLSIHQRLRSKVTTFGAFAPPGSRELASTTGLAPTSSSLDNLLPAVPPAADRDAASGS